MASLQRRPQLFEYSLPFSLRLESNHKLGKLLGFPIKIVCKKEMQWMIIFILFLFGHDHDLYVERKKCNPTSPVNHPGERPHRGIKGVRHAQRHPGQGRRERLRQEAGQPFPEPAQGPARPRPHQGPLRAVPRNRVRFSIHSFIRSSGAKICRLLSSAGSSSSSSSKCFVQQSMVVWFISC